VIRDEGTVAGANTGCRADKIVGLEIAERYALRFRIVNEKRKRNILR
jgi:hypothetical protein